MLKLIHFSNKIYGSNFIKQHSEAVMVWNYQNADCSFRKKNLWCHLLQFSAHFRSLSKRVCVDPSRVTASTRPADEFRRGQKVAVGRLPLLSARPAVTLETLNRAATNFAARWTEARWVWTVCLRQRRNCDLNGGPSAPESSALTTRLPSQREAAIRKSSELRRLGGGLDYCNAALSVSQVVAVYTTSVHHHSVHCAFIQAHPLTPSPPHSAAR